jgi:hypothetical protein
MPLREERVSAGMAPPSIDPGPGKPLWKVAATISFLKPL